MPSSDSLSSFSSASTNSRADLIKKYELRESKRAYSVVESTFSSGRGKSTSRRSRVVVFDVCNGREASWPGAEVHRFSVLAHEFTTTFAFALWMLYSDLIASKNVMVFNTYGVVMEIFNRMENTLFLKKYFNTKLTFNLKIFAHVHPLVKEKVK